MFVKAALGVLATLWFADVVVPMYSSKAMEGYPVGYLSDCPGFGKEPVIKQKTLKHLRIAVHGFGPNRTTRKKYYNYFQMKKLAKDPNINWNKKTMMFIGGFLDSPNFFIAGTLGPEYKKLGYNTLLLDTNYFTTMEYPLASIFIRAVGKHAAEMLANLTKTGLDPKKLELVGISLGGHTMSFVAKNYRLLTGTNISRLTGLDPAGPCFRNLGPDDRLDQTDADFVDVISTNIDGFGMAAPVGHVNFYVNGGEFQPGDVIWMPCNTLCSHIRSFTLWFAALRNQNSFIAMKCDSVQDAREKNCYDRKPMETNIVGLGTDKSKEGIYFLATHNNFPYFLGEKGLRKDNEFFHSLMKGFLDHQSTEL